MATDVQTATLDDARDALKRLWGYDEFRPLQAEAISAVLSHRDSLVVLPTGGGKSVCYQLPAVLLEGLAVVVSPLIALMKDQVDSLREIGVAAACIHSGMTNDERRRADDAVQSGRVKLLYVAPERLVMPSFLEYLDGLPLSFLAVDEAHCISHWGHDFRPEYRALRVLKERFADKAVHAFTATATPQVRDDIALQLGLKNPAVQVGDFRRANLVYRAFPRHDMIGQVTEIVERHKGDSGIIYAISRKNVEELAAELIRAGYRALAYHAGMDPAERTRTQEAFVHDEIDIIVATVAFGMGIDKPDVRYVIHAAMPKSVEHYQQESGRAGRDGLEAECCLLYGNGDGMMWLRLQNNADEEGVALARDKLRSMEDYCHSAQCRHAFLVGYFGQKIEAATCGACDVCLGEAEKVGDALVTAQKILSCVVRLGSFAGPAYTNRVLCAVNDKKIVERGHDKLSTWGLLRDQPQTAVRAWLDQLLAQGYLEKGDFHVLRLTDRGKRVLRGEETPVLLETAAKKTKRRAVRERAGWDGVDRDLFEALRAVRKELALARDVPAFVIFNDVTLREMARRPPSTEAEMLGIKGVGERKFAEFGPTFLRRIREFREGESSREPRAPGSASTHDATDSDVGDDDTSAVRAPSAGERQAYRLFEEGRSIDAVAAQLNRARSTTVGYLVRYLGASGQTDPHPWVSNEDFGCICEGLKVITDERLRPLYDHFEEKYDYDTLRIARRCYLNSQSQEQP
ncbi:MAG: DNA helicase RecQ [Candidatus Hydrogenedentales bacterium]